MTSGDDTIIRRARLRRRLRLAGAGVAAAIALGVAAVTTTAAQAAPTPPPDAAGTAELQAAGVGGGLGSIPNPGPGFRIKAVYKVTSGTQTYTCDATTGTWNPKSTPEAQLLRYLSRDRIHHFGGPRWASERDGSTIVAAVRADATVQKPGTIPWLLLDVTAHEGPVGELTPVTHVSRIRTTGGVAPTGTCTAGQTQAVKYTADYIFWVKR